MTLEVLLTPAALRPDDVRGRMVVVIDVLRACTTIVTALEHGARAVIPVTAPGEAGRIASTMDADTVRLSGERDALPIPEYHFANSPRDFTSEAMGGKTLILSTTNGSGLFNAVEKAEAVVAGCLRNAAAVAETIRANEDDALLVCAGWRGEPSIEDTLCAGYMAHLVWNGVMPADADDGARMAHRLYLAERGDLAGALAESTHGRRLASLGHADDVAFCAVADASTLVPRFDGLRIRA